MGTYLRRASPNWLSLLAGTLALTLTIPARAQNPPTPPPPPATASPAAPTPAKNPGLAADLAPFKNLAEQVKAAFDKGQTDVAKAKVKETESTWDKEEARLRPKYPTVWKLLDQKLDLVIKIFGQSRPDPKQAGPALDDLIAKLTTPEA